MGNNKAIFYKYGSYMKVLFSVKCPVREVCRFSEIPSQGNFNSTAVRFLVFLLKTCKKAFQYDAYLPLFLVREGGLPNPHWMPTPCRQTPVKADTPGGRPPQRKTPVEADPPPPNKMTGTRKNTRLRPVKISCF